jgi:opacity protein-like surface antigen
MWSQVDGNFTVPPLTSWSTNQSAGILDGHVGLQQQFGSVVLGVEGSYVFAFGNSFGTAACSPAVACTANTLLAERIDNIWTVGPRIGWAIGAWMPYATGGYARATIENQTLSPTPTTLETGDTQNGGWYAGGGVEWNFARNWYTGIEYKHYDFGTVTTVPTFVTGGPDTFNTKSISATADTVSARLSYKFDWGNP